MIKRYNQAVTSWNKA